jgi:nucleotidyltransferase/DNA polymerase involved in DNA repair
MIPSNFAKYRAASEKIRTIFAEYDPRFLPMSLDEARDPFRAQLTCRVCCLCVHRPT